MARVKELSFHFSQGQNRKTRSTVFLRRLKSLWLKKLSSSYRPSSWWACGKANVVDGLLQLHNNVWRSPLCPGFAGQSNEVVTCEEEFIKTPL